MTATSEALWEQAFKPLNEKQQDILKRYAGQSSELNKILIDKVLREREIKQWTVSLAGKSLKVRELGLKVIGYISGSQSYVSTATSFEPHAAMAWTCVSALLPVRPLHLLLWKLLTVNS